MKALIVAAALVLTTTMVAVQQAPEVVVQQRDSNPAGAASFALFGGKETWVAAASVNGVRIIDVASGKLARILPLFSYFTTHPTQNFIVGSGSGGTLVALDVITGAERWRTRTTNDGTAMSMSLHIDPDQDVLTAVMAFNRRDGKSDKGSRDRSTLIGEDRIQYRTGQWRASTGAALGMRDGYSTFDGRWRLEATLVPQRVDRQRSMATYRLQWRDAQSGRAEGRPFTLRRSFMLGSSEARQVIIGNYDEVGFDWNAGTEVVLRLVDVDTGAVLSEFKPSFSSVDQSAGSSEWKFGPPNNAGRARLIAAGAAATAPAPVPAPAAAAAESDPASAMAAVLNGKAVAPPIEVAGTFTGDGRWFVARAPDLQVDVWDLATGNRMPFRLAAPPRRTGPIRVTSGENTDPSRWHAIDVQSDGTSRDPDVNASYVQSLTAQMMSGASGCRSERFLLRSTVAGKGTAVALVEAATNRAVSDLTSLKLDLRAGCSLSPDGQRAVVMAPGRKLSRGTQSSLKEDPQQVYLRGMTPSADLEALGVPLAVVDLVNRREPVPLRSRDRAERQDEFPFFASELMWSADSRYVLRPVIALGPERPAGSNRAWVATTGEEVDLVTPGIATATFCGTVPGGAQLLTASSLGSPGSQNWASLMMSGRDVDVWDLDARQKILRWSGSSACGLSTMSDTLLMRARSVATVNLASSSRVWIGPDPDGALWIRDRRSGDLLGQLRLLGDGEWLVTTPSGLFDGSPAGWRKLSWRAPDGLKVDAGEMFFSEFYQPGLLAELLAGRTPRAVRAIADRDRRQPAVTLALSDTDARLARVIVTAREARGGSQAGSGVRDLRLFRNGVLVKVWRGELPLDANGEARVEARLPLVAGGNQIVAYAFNRDNIKSADATTSLTSAAVARPGAVYVLAIGVNEYANDAFNLRYAVPDATAFATMFAARQQSLGTPAVRVATLLDHEATRANIQLALARLAGTATGALPAGAPAGLSQLSAVQPEDSVVVYFAGHGIAVDDRFHLIPTDMAYRGPREWAAAALPALIGNSLSDLDLERAFEPLDARHLLLIIDACNSGQALEVAENRFGPMNSRGLAHLAYEKGMSILTASQAYQAAMESSRLGHGYLTYALVEEGLTSAVADQTPKDGDVTAQEWFAYAAERVPQLQVAAMQQAQQAGRALTFDLAPAAPGSGRLQTPRVFSSRDALNGPFIVTRPSPH